MILQQAIRELTEGRDLGREQTRAAMQTIMTGEASGAQIGGFLVALRMKGETVTEIAAAVEVMRELATPVPVDERYKTTLVDIVGTGGDASGLFNVSTASSFVVAAAGGHVAKHGNRAVSGKSGAADVLEAAGVALSLSPEAVAQCVRELGVGFMFAPAFHSAMKHAIGPRKEMAVRTVFNLLGPLTNPAGAPNQLIGVFDRQWLRPLAEVLRELGSRHVMLVHSDDGLDEISCAETTHYCELKDGEISSGSMSPQDFGMTPASLQAIQVADAQQSLEMVRAALANQPGAARSIVTLNSGAALYLAGQAADLAGGVELAQETLASGQAADKLEALAVLSRKLAA